MRNGLVAIVLVVLVAGSLGLGYLTGISNRQTITTTYTQFLSTTTTETSTSMGVCGNLTRQPPQAHLMLVAPKSMGIVCLFYGVTSAQQAEFDSDIQSLGSIYSLSSPKNPTLAKGINMTILSVLSTPNNETVEYSIRTSGNSTGAYTWWAPGTCPGIPLVVGLNITSSAQADLKSYYSAAGVYCQELFFIPEFDGVSGISLLSFTS